jgi:putative nucleotidyltransferase with HDIG domain
MRQNVSVHTLRNQAYLGLVISGGVLAVGTSVHQLATSNVGLPWLVLAAFTILSGFATLRLPNIPVAFSISDAFTFTAAVFFGPAAGAVAVALDSLVISLQLAKRKFSVRQLLFNASAPALAMWGAAHGFFWIIGGPVSPTMSLGLFFTALLILTGLYFIFNTSSIALAIAFDQRKGPFEIWRTHFLPLWLTYFGGAIVAALLFVLISSGVADPIVLVLVVPIPLILYAAFKSVVGRLGDQFEHLGQVNKMYLSTIEALATAINAKDGVTHDHIRRVQAYAVGLARVLGVNDESTIKAIEAAALLHDTGKLAVPEHILNKPGSLTPAEFEKMKLHVDVGADILSTIDFPYPVVPIVRCHHENWDGSGYPRGIAGQEIPIGARILSVVDCFDALTSDRPYRRAVTEQEAFDILTARRGTMYDPVIVDTFIRVHKDLAPPAPQAPRHEDALAKITRAAAPVPTVPTTAADVGTADADNLLSLISVARLASNQASPDDVASLTATLVRNLAPGTTCAFYIKHDEELVMTHAAGPLAPALRWMRMPVSERLSGWVAAHRRTIVNSDAALDLAGLDIPTVPRTCLSTPLLDGETLVGVLTLYAEFPMSFTDEQGRMMQMLGPHLALLARRMSAGAAPASSSGQSRANAEGHLRIVSKR